MSKKLSLLTVIVLTVCLVSASMAYAKWNKAPKVKNIPNRCAGKSNIGHLYLVEKDPSTWEIIRPGAWGKMMYRLSAPMFCLVFNARRLIPEAKYSLIYYPDPWPGEGLICLGSGIANQFGNLHIMNCTETGDLPAEFDENFPDGAKLWLVLTDDVDLEKAKMVGWNPTEYLFEYDLITFDDTEE